MFVVAGSQRMWWEGRGGGGVAGSGEGWHLGKVLLALLLPLLPSPGAGQHLLSIPRQPRTQSE